MQNKKKWLEASNFLGNLPGTSISQEFKDLAASKKATIIDNELYVRDTISNGTKKLLQERNKSKIGETNFDGNRLQNNQYFVVDAIMINYGTAADGTPVQHVNYNSALPAALKAANLLIKQNGSTLLTLPIASIDRAKQTDEIYRELGGFVFLSDTTEIEIEIEMPGNANLDAGSAHYVEVLLKGFQTSVKN